MRNDQTFRPQPVYDVARGAVTVTLVPKMPNKTTVQHRRHLRIYRDKESGDIVRVRIIRLAKLIRTTGWTPAEKRAHKRFNKRLKESLGHEPTLEEYAAALIAEHKGKKPRPVPTVYYNSDGDSIEVYLRREASVADGMPTDSIVLHRERKSGKVVRFDLNGIRHYSRHRPIANPPPE